MSRRLTLRFRKKRRTPRLFPPRTNKVTRTSMAPSASPARRVSAAIPTSASKAVIPFNAILFNLILELPTYRLLPRVNHGVARSAPQGNLQMKKSLSIGPPAKAIARARVVNAWERQPPTIIRR
jgi:hypothetical protein